MWQRNDAVEVQIQNTQAFYHWATALSMLYEMQICCKTENFTLSVQFRFQSVPLILTKKTSTYT